MFDIVIIGAGPAGLTAAIYGKRANKNVLVLEKNTYGGQIITSSKVENYPGFKNITGYEFATNIYNQAKDLGADIKFENVIALKDNDKYKLVVTDKNEYKAKSVIIATGSKKRMLGLKGEKELIGKGISYCATCDGNFFKNKEVAVIGGGNTAIEEAIYLSGICKKVYIIYRKDEFRADQKEINIINKKDNIEILFNSEVIELISDNILTGIEIINNITNEKKQINISGLFIAIGQIPNNEIFNDLINIDDFGYIKASEDCKTNIEGIFVAGDCRIKKYRQLTTAASDGTIAALNAVEYLKKENKNENRKNK